MSLQMLESQRKVKNIALMKTDDCLTSVLGAPHVLLSVSLVSVCVSSYLSTTNTHTHTRCAEVKQWESELMKATEEKEKEIDG